MTENENFCNMTYTFVIYLWWIISRNSTMFTKNNLIFEHFWHQKGPKKWPEMKILQNDPKIHDPHPKILRNEYKYCYVIFGSIWPPKTGQKWACPKGTPGGSDS